jgi:CheY-like chemotaxis protein
MMSARGRVLAGVHVLIVDDNPAALELYRLILAVYGATVTVASTAREALAELDRMPPDAVIADIVLGRGEDGVWLRRNARRAWPDVPFIAISGELIDEEAVARATFTSYLRKPVTERMLVDAVLTAIAG